MHDPPNLDAALKSKRPAVVNATASADSLSSLIHVAERIAETSQCREPVYAPVLFLPKPSSAEWMCMRAGRTAATLGGRRPRSVLLLSGWGAFVVFFRYAQSVHSVARPTPASRSVMKTHVLRGSKQQIAEDLARINGEVREAIVFVDEPAPPATGAATHESEDIFAEMRPFMVDEDGVDDSRAAIYTRMEGE